jgi:hypothetical protein
MKWVRERDLLIAQTLAFVQSVSGKKPVVGAPPQNSSKNLKPEIKVEDLVQAVLNPPRDQLIAETPRLSASPPKDLRQEIERRIALFRAHQQRFHKERDTYFVSTMAQLRILENPNRPAVCETADLASAISHKKNPASRRDFLCSPSYSTS